MAGLKRARGKRARAISDRSGFEVPYTSLKTTWDNLRVEPEEWEAKHPQLEPPRNVIDATALFDPRPDSDPDNISFFVGFNYDPFLDRNQRPNVGISGRAVAGRVLIETEQVVTGVSGTGGVGTESLDLSINESGVAGTGGVGSVGLNGISGVSGTGGAGSVGVEALNLSIDETGVSGTGGVGNESVNIMGWGQGAWNDGTWGDG